MADRFQASRDRDAPAPDGGANYYATIRRFSRALSVASGYSPTDQGPKCWRYSMILFIVAHPRRIRFSIMSPAES
jgi:hypothetical protein